MGAFVLFIGFSASAFPQSYRLSSPHNLCFRLFVTAARKAIDPKSGDSRIMRLQRALVGPLFLSFFMQVISVQIEEMTEILIIKSIANSGMPWPNRSRVVGNMLIYRVLLEQSSDASVCTCCLRLLVGLITS